MATIVRDDLAADMTTGGGTWVTTAMPRFYSNSATWPPFSSNSRGDTGQYGSFTLNFKGVYSVNTCIHIQEDMKSCLGTSVAFIGNTPNALSSQWAFVSIDGELEYNISYMDPAPPSARQWFQSPTLSDGTHTINVSRIAGTSIDFVVITAGQDTPLSGETLIVDDGDPSIAYRGEWKVNPNLYTSHDAPRVGLPYGNTTHQTSSVGASATFQFSGMPYPAREKIDGWLTMQ